MNIRALLRVMLTLILVAAALAAVYYTDVLSPELRAFFLEAWYIQGFNTWMFLVGAWIVVERWIPTGKARQLGVHADIPSRVSSSEAKRILSKWPPEWNDTMYGRRLFGLLDAQDNGDGLRDINEILSRQDSRRLEGGHITVDAIRNVIPVVGFLGTVIGLSVGMLSFPDFASPEGLRPALQEFSRSLSFAFNTTLLALFYAILLTFMSMALREAERRLTDDIDESAEKLIRALR